MPYLEIGCLQKLVVKIRSYWIGMGPPCKMTGVLTRRDAPRKEEGHVKAEAETGVRHLHA